ncbi:hypothetical protein M501DRAFT_988306 [Patellaria atrata CBS 101060]|uniref:UBC core domain-containing protein n=1 Tax=Patellaria atrata CBS 101060 TaxID=1346257 RepID=A0A9P4VVU2_9PEZI|nr:hypothetical protein M501DRAFT_988306 [Patellaria atrata CBS 101060]
MSVSTRHFCVSDTCALQDDQNSLGVVMRTLADVDSHDPDPIKDYKEGIARDEDISHALFHDFLSSGVPPKGTVLVAWFYQSRPSLIPEAKLRLLDRTLVIGDVVKRDLQSAMSGTVIGIYGECVLHYPQRFDKSFNDARTIQRLFDVVPYEFVPGVPIDELESAEKWYEGDFMIFRGWVGRVEHVDREVTLLLANGTVVVVENSEELEYVGLESEEGLSLGCCVRTTRGNLRRGTWKLGAFNPNIDPVGIIVSLRPFNISVVWLLNGAPRYISSNPPPSELNCDFYERERGNFKKYDSSRLPATTNDRFSDYDETVFAPGACVKFKDIAAACVKYDGRTSIDGFSRGKVVRIPTEDTLGVDLNTFHVLRTSTRAKVLWQDLTTSIQQAVDLIPDWNIGDEDEVWPGEIVFSPSNRKNLTSQSYASFKPTKVGVVQSVNAQDRLASVRWFDNPEIHFFGRHLRHPARTGNLSGPAEDVSMYDIQSLLTITRRRGDFVYLNHNYTGALHPDGINVIDWFGKVVDLDLDGSVSVRLGALDEVRDIKVPAECLTLVYSEDMFSDDGSTDSDATGDSRDDLVTDRNITYEYEYEGNGGRPLDYDDEGDGWTTDDDADNGLESPRSLEVEGIGDPVATIESTTPSGTQLIQDDRDNSATMTLVSSDTSKPTDYPSSSPLLPSFSVLDDLVPVNHHFITSQPLSHTSLNKRRILKEHNMLSSSLPQGIYVRTWESRLDLLRVLIIGPTDTPYELAPFLFDLRLTETFPNTPPKAFFHSWTGGQGPVNPNLYEDGTICLSLLGTWHADGKSENWTPGKSTILQVLVSLLGLVLVKDPFYNEAGYDVRAGSEESAMASKRYSERAYCGARNFIIHALKYPPEGVETEIKHLYGAINDDTSGLLQKAIKNLEEVVERSQSNEGGGTERRVSKGALVLLRRQIQQLRELDRVGDIEMTDVNSLS